MTYYHANGQATAVLEALGHTSFTDFDADGRITASIDPLGTRR